jgi:hypothetical protein
VLLQRGLLFTNDAHNVFVAFYSTNVNTDIIVLSTNPSDAITRLLANVRTNLGADFCIAII